MQVIYAFIAMMLVALLSLTLQRGIHATERRQIVNEVSTQLVGVGIDILEHIGHQSFDEKVDSMKVPVFPPVRTAAELTPSSSFGDCVDYDVCDDIDDFDGVSVTRTVDGVSYEASIEVLYVDEDDPGTPVAAQSFAKEVRVAVSSPDLYLSSPDNLLTVEIARVFAYDRATAD